MKIGDIEYQSVCEFEGALRQGWKLCDCYEYVYRGDVKKCPACLGLSTREEKDSKEQDDFTKIIRYGNQERMIIFPDGTTKEVFSFCSGVIDSFFSTIPKPLDFDYFVEFVDKGIIDHCRIAVGILKKKPDADKAYIKTCLEKNVFKPVLRFVGRKQTMIKQFFMKRVKTPQMNERKSIIIPGSFNEEILKNLRDGETKISFIALAIRKEIEERKRTCQR